MGYVNRRSSKGGQVRYTAIYRNLKGQLLSAGTFDTYDEARDAWRAVEKDLEAGKIGNPRRGRQTVTRYVEEEWFPNHVIELTTRENYRYILNKYVLPELGGMRMVEVLPGSIREWITTLQTKYAANPPTIQRCKTVVDAIFTTALNDQIVFIHPSRGVKTPPVARRPKRIITVEQFDMIHEALPDGTMRLLVETDIESGLRWGELTELRVRDLDFTVGVVTVSRVVVELKSRDRPDGVRFVVKQYPKDKEWRQVGLLPQIVDKLRAHVKARGLGPDDLLFPMPEQEQPVPKPELLVLPDPDTLGLTEPNDKGRRYRHGTTTGYAAGRCRCEHCRAAIATYRAARRASGMDPSRPARRRRAVEPGGHISNDWFRVNVWSKALAKADLGFHVTPHGLRHAHASWLLAGGADLQVVKERLGHGRISTTEGYLHSLPGAHDAALAALSAIRGVPQAVEDGGAQASGVVDAAAELAAMRQMLAELKDLYQGGRPA